jgi:hypothetical protein
MPNRTTNLVCQIEGRALIDRPTRVKARLVMGLTMDPDARKQSVAARPGSIPLRDERRRAQRCQLSHHRRSDRTHRCCSGRRLGFCACGEPLFDREVGHTVRDDRRVAGTTAERCMISERTADVIAAL